MYCNSYDCDSCNPVHECGVCGFNYRGYCRDCEDFEDGLPDAFPFDFVAIKASIESGTITFPKGLDHEDRALFIKRKLEELE